MKSEAWRTTNDGASVTLTMEAMEYAESARRVYELAVEIAARTLAEQIVKDHGQEIVAKCDMQAIANLTVAEASNAIRETIHRKLPDVVHTRTEERVYQRGIFGGITRVR